ncbi:MAG: nitrilase [Phycisphaerales bacterium]|nr:nitrilase [Phycisphaerales bacterium]
MRYYAAAIQTSFTCPLDRSAIPARITRMLEMAGGTIEAYAPFHDVRLLAFPEFAHTVPVYRTVAELKDHLAVEAGDIAPAYERFCRDHGCFIQTGSFVERDAKYPDVLFNTTLLVGPTGVLSKYRKVNPWIPWEVHASPHDVPGYSEPLFPVADTEIGKIGCAICYDWLFPEAIRELASGGAEVLVRVSAYMDPWGGTSPMEWWTLFNRVRAIESMAYVVAANQGATIRDYPAFSWPGSSMIVDFDGRVLAQAEPGPFEKVVVAPIDIGALRQERQRRRGHSMLAHIRSEAYPYLQVPRLPPAGSKEITIALNEARTAASQARVGY